MPTSLFGGFSDPPVLSTDTDPKKTDTYDKAEVIPSRYTGANFKVGKPKKGHGRDVYFSKDFPTMASGEQNAGKKTDEYLDAGVLARREAKARKAKNIDPNRDFKFANPPKRTTGAGSFFGTFDGKPVEHKPEYKVQPRTEPSAKREIKTQKNILTSPPRKGTYGMLGTTFSKIEGGKVSDDYDALRKLEQERWKKSKEKMISETTFRNTIKPMRSFDQKGQTGVSSAYDHYDPPEEKKSKKRAAEKPKADKSKLEGRPTFRFSSGPKTGREGNLNGFPNVRGDKPDPFDAAALKRTREERDAEHDAAKKKMLGGTWKPVSGPKNGVVRSLLKTYY